MESLLISACLLGENCKYNGGSNALPAELLERLRQRYVLVPVCPERLGGLPTPRPPALLWGGDGFAVLDRALLNPMGEKKYSADTAEREEQVKNDLAAACITKGRRPSVETSMHNCLEAAYIVHLHPTLVGGLMCAKDAAEKYANAKLVLLEGDDHNYHSHLDLACAAVQEFVRSLG